MHKSNQSLRRYSYKIFVLILLFSVIFGFMLWRRAELEKYRKEEIKVFQNIAEVYAEKYSLEIPLVMAVMECESGFDSSAVSSAGACGLMQIMPSTFNWLIKTETEPHDIFDSEDNIKLGCKYLAYLLGKFESEETALAAYNAGEGNVSAWLKDKAFSKDGKKLDSIPFPETAEYVAKVLRTREGYRQK